MEGQQRRILIAFLLMAAVLVGSQWWYGRMAPSVTEPAPADTSLVVADPALPDAGSPLAPTGRDPVDAPSPLPEPAAGDTTAAAADTAAPPAGGMRNVLLEGRPPPGTVRVETPLYRVWIDPLGGTLAQVELVRYPSFVTDTSAVALVPPDGAFLRRAADLGEVRLAIGEHVFLPSDSLIRLAEGDASRDLRLEYRDSDGSMVQTYRFDPDTYVIDYELQLGRPHDGVLVTGISPRLHSNEKKPREDYDQLRAVARVEGEIVSLQAKNVDEGETATYSGRIDWAGLRSKYFLGALLASPDGPGLTALTVQGETDSLPNIGMLIAAPIEDGRAGYRLYFGPQEYSRLAELNEGLDGVQQYGWSWIRWMIDPFAKLTVVVMLWLHQFIPSYGLVLVVFAVLVRLVLWPLTIKSFRSIQEMQKLQPEIARLRERYKDDPQRMQQETMKLYRERKVNPLGGCLPNLIPMPILFALFFVFQATIEFRGQPFLWLPDLSQPDPWYILPVFMGLTMFASSKITTTDPKMSAMVYVMPIVLTFVFLNLAAGLVLYYSLSNLLTFAQQWWIRRQSLGAELEEAPAG
ncbi:MAG TPA: membrane protein insertase YidC [Gemmatimonadota bacterium]|nr:membrane protein insertase YidC [Gemmatimonadota bacterium]